jgi:hypothetical protein
MFEHGFVEIGVGLRWTRLLWETVSLNVLISYVDYSLCVHRRSPLVPLPKQMVRVHTLTPCFCKIHFNIILSSTPMSVYVL